MHKTWIINDDSCTVVYSNEKKGKSDVVVENSV